MTSSCIICVPLTGGNNYLVLGRYNVPAALSQKELLNSIPLSASYANEDDAEAKISAEELEALSDLIEFNTETECISSCSLSGAIATHRRTGGYELRVMVTLLTVLLSTLG